MEAVAAAPARTQALPRPLRVLFVAPRARGGLGRHVLGLLAHLDRARFHPLLACPADGSVAEEAAALGVEASPLPIGPGGLRCFRLAWHLAALAGQQQADIIHAHGFQAGLTAAWARRFASLCGGLPAPRLICTFHSFPPSRGWRTCRALRAIARGADRIIAVSAALGREVTELAGARVRLLVIPNGIELKAMAGCCDLRAEHSLPPESKIIGLVARLAPQKGIDIFLRAASQASRASAGLRFLVVGDGPLRAEAEAQAKALGLEGRVVFAGHREDARSLIRDLDLLVIASTSEGSSLVAMEAMAEGKPVVAAAAGALPEIIGDGVTGRLTPPGDPASLARAIVEVISDQEKARELGAAGRGRAEREFRIEVMVEQTESVYEEVFARG